MREPSVYADLSDDERDSVLSVGVTLLLEGVDELISAGELSELQARRWAAITAQASRTALRRRHDA